MLGVDFIIILIGDESHVGKTLLTQRLLEKYKIPYTIIDTCKENGQSIVLEGCYLPPDKVQQLVYDFIGHKLRKC